MSGAKSSSVHPPPHALRHGHTRRDSAAPGEPRPPHSETNFGRAPLPPLIPHAAARVRAGEAPCSFHLLHLPAVPAAGSPRGWHRRGGSQTGLCRGAGPCHPAASGLGLPQCAGRRVMPLQTSSPSFRLPLFASRSSLLFPSKVPGKSWSLPSWGKGYESDLSTREKEHGFFKACFHTFPRPSPSSSAEGARRVQAWRGCRSLAKPACPALRWGVGTGGCLGTEAPRL